MLVNSPTDFDYLEIGLASPDRIRFWSFGEIEKPETINYRTFKPERKGLFCEKIFGPVKDWECSCGKYRRVRYRGIVCERCGVEVTHSKVRRERMGHIELAAPVTHIWFLKGIPSYLGLILDMSTRQLEEVIYYDSYIVTDVHDDLKGEFYEKQLLPVADYFAVKQKYGNKVKVDIGASAIQTVLSNIKVGHEIEKLRNELGEVKGQKRLKVTKRLRVLEAIEKSGNRPEWVVLEAIPVMPPDLRPMVQLEGGRFATSDLNDLYRRVVNRNNRLKRLMDIGAPEMIVRNEKRMLQEAVDVLISNGKRGRSVTGSNGRPLKSLGNIIEGKQGRFRQNLLGKRVDYSARSVIVVGPHLKFYQCGLPKEMALELFKPFVIRKLVSDGLVTNVKSAKRKIERREVIVWDILEKVIKGQPVLLNRAPTLHRLGIQSFQPVLVEGSAIQIHPLVCTAFNADFDGDQMAVHVPLSVEAQTECRLLIMSDNNILSPSSGRSIVTPTQDMVLGCYYLTIEDPENELGKGKVFVDIHEAWRAFHAKAINFQSDISIRVNGERLRTTMGRLIFNEVIWEVLDSRGIERVPFINYVVGKKQLSELVYQWYLQFGNQVTADLIDKLKYIGFKYAAQSGISISIDDLTVPKEKNVILQDAQSEIENLDNMSSKNLISEAEKRSRSIEVWRSATAKVSNALNNEMGRLNNVYIMANSGARGNMDQVRQLAGMRGLMSDSQGRTVDIPIRSNFKEGLSLTEYFISAYGARKGLVDTALRTADSGYLTRRLVDVAQDVMITIEDCGTTEGVETRPIMSGVNTLVSLSEMLEGRVSLEDVTHPDTNELLLENGGLITRKLSVEIEEAGIESVTTRSVYHCKAERGLCQKCYGLDLATARLVNLGEAVGIIAAQSIGEPGTQLTMRTFHTGGVDLRKASRVSITSPQDGKVSFSENLVVNPLSEDGNKLWIAVTEGHLQIQSGKATRSVLIPKGSNLLVKPDDSVEKGQEIAAFDPTDVYISSDSNGVVQFLDVETKEEKDANGKVINYLATKDSEIFLRYADKTQDIEVPKAVADLCEVGKRISSSVFEKSEIQSGGLVLDVKKSKKEVKDKRKNEVYVVTIAQGEAYTFASGSKIFVKDGDKTKSGDILFKERYDEDSSKTQDIVQGLPRVEELFEARKPKDASFLSELTGIVDIDISEYYRTVIITSEEGERKEYKVPKDSRLLVHSGQKVQKGDQLNSGGINPHDISTTKGVAATQMYLSTEVQRVYRSQGVSINTKHIEVIVRQMTRKVSITEMGDSTFLLNEMIDIRTLNRVNRELEENDKAPAGGDRVLLGITRASLNTESFISASSFQQTASVLTKAAIEGQIDPMEGLKENVIIGKLIPAGTGLKDYNFVNVINQEEEIEEEAHA